MRAGLSGSGGPAVWQQFIEPVDGVVGDAAENVAEPGKRIYLNEFAGSDETAQYRRCLTAFVAAEESPIIPSDREAPQRPLRRIVINRQIAVAAVSGQRRPVLQW